MKIVFVTASMLLVWLSSVAQKVQLAPPFLDYRSVFFAGEGSVGIKFNMKGSSIRYTIDGTDPTSGSPLYAGLIIIKKSLTTVTAKSFAPGFLSSDAVQVTFIADGYAIQSAEFPTPDKRFSGHGPATLVDNLGGMPAIGNSNWLGYRDDSVTISIKLRDKQPVSKVLIDLLRDHGSWVFLPQRIAVMYFDSVAGTFKPFGSKEMTGQKVLTGAACDYQVIESSNPVTTDRLQIKLQVLQSIPDDHPGKGTKSWIFIDEIKVY